MNRGGQRKPTEYVLRHLLDDIEKLGEKRTIEYDSPFFDGKN